MSQALITFLIALTILVGVVGSVIPVMPDVVLI
jgi:uncharacterized protein YqgC (DUF456 family)